MPLKIHAAVQNTDHVDSGRCLTIEDDVGLGRISQVSIPNDCVGTAELWSCGDGLDRCLYLPGVQLCLTDIPMMSSVVPNFFDIGFRSR